MLRKSTGRFAQLLFQRRPCFFPEYPETCRASVVQVDQTSQYTTLAYSVRTLWCQEWQSVCALCSLRLFLLFPLIAFIPPFVDILRHWTSTGITQYQPSPPDQENIDWQDVERESVGSNLNSPRPGLNPMEHQTSDLRVGGSNPPRRT